MFKGLLILAGLLFGGLIALAVTATILLPVLGLVTAVIVAGIKLALLVAVLYFIVKLISPETADRAVDKVRRTVRKVA